MSGRGNSGSPKSPLAPLLFLLALLLGGCGTARDQRPHEGPQTSGTTVVLDVDHRPFRLQVPASYDGGRPVPLVVGLHGWGGDGARIGGQLGLTTSTDSRGWLLALPDGTVDSRGRRFWNASAACCNLDGAAVDDVAYLSHVVEAVAADYAVDPARVYVAGLSNGGFMAHRLACERSDLVSAVVAVAGTTAADPPACTPTEGVSVLQVHGTADAVIRYEGGALLPGHPYASAPDTVAAWREREHCSTAARPGPPLDSDASLPGAETSRTTWPGCDDRSAVSLWTVAGGAHSPQVTAAFADALVGWLAHHDAVRRPPRR
ncbi:PHB depolymerase family esterase [Nocardioides aestuarii]|uniref:Alpha/beta hydrolase family esterase n=1 Tax=Nocardioides aestuarii TaxID=252231 RepID=A0ABW4TJM6_9ACTN